MRISKHFWRRGALGVSLLCAAALLPTCGGGERQADANEELATLDSAALRQEYQRLMAARGEVFPTQQITEAGKLYPVDQAPLDTAFFVFRESLLEAVKARNAFAVVSHSHEQIRSGRGADETGLPAFIRIWRLDVPENIEESPLWETLERVLSLGGAFSDERARFVAPYIRATWPKNHDASRYGAVAGAGVRLRSAPGLSGKILTMVNHDVVEVLGVDDHTDTINGETFPWHHIRAAGGQEGYVWGKFLYRGNDYHAVFTREKGRWKMSALLAGG